MKSTNFNIQGVHKVLIQFQNFFMKSISKFFYEVNFGQRTLPKLEVNSQNILTKLVLFESVLLKVFI